MALERRARGRRLREHRDDPAAVVPRVVLGARRRREAGAVLAEALEGKARDEADALGARRRRVRRERAKDGRRVPGPTRRRRRGGRGRRSARIRRRRRGLDADRPSMHSSRGGCGCAVRWRAAATHSDCDAHSHGPPYVPLHEDARGPSTERRRRSGRGGRRGRARRRRGRRRRRRAGARRAAGEDGEEEGGRLEEGSAEAEGRADELSTQGEEERVAEEGACAEHNEERLCQRVGRALVGARLAEGDRADVEIELAPQPLALVSGVEEGKPERHRQPHPKQQRDEEPPGRRRRRIAWLAGGDRAR